MVWGCGIKKEAIPFCNGGFKKLGHDGRNVLETKI